MTDYEWSYKRFSYLYYMDCSPKQKELKDEYWETRAALASLSPSISNRTLMWEQLRECVRAQQYITAHRDRIKKKTEALLHELGRVPELTPISHYEEAEAALLEHRRDTIKAKISYHLEQLHCLEVDRDIQSVVLRLPENISYDKYIQWGPCNGELSAGGDGGN